MGKFAGKIQASVECFAGASGRRSPANRRYGDGDDQWRVVRRDRCGDKESLAVQNHHVLRLWERDRRWLYAYKVGVCSWELRGGWHPVWTRVGSESRRRRCGAAEVFTVASWSASVSSVQ